MTLELEEECGVINWSLEVTDRFGSRLYALWNRTAGDCLLGWRNDTCLLHICTYVLCYVLSSAFIPTLSWLEEQWTCFQIGNIHLAGKKKGHRDDL